MASYIFHFKCKILVSYSQWKYADHRPTIASTRERIIICFLYWTLCIFSQEKPHISVNLILWMSKWCSVGVCNVNFSQKKCDGNATSVTFNFNFRTSSVEHFWWGSLSAAEREYFFCISFWIHLCAVWNTNVDFNLNKMKNRKYRIFL